jgi:hypothetical protein
VARVELPPLPPAEAKKFLIEASFSFDDLFFDYCLFDVHFRFFIEARLLVTVCAV